MIYFSYISNYSFTPQIFTEHLTVTQASFVPLVVAQHWGDSSEDGKKRLAGV